MGKKFDKCFQFYEKAIEGRNFHYQNYNQWVNLYAIFTGAIFVGYYSVCGLLQLLLAFLGIVTSICWLNSVRGYYHWMLSWIKVVQEYENKLQTLGSNITYRVYSVHKQIDSNNISSQKIMKIFICFIIISWSILFSSKLITVCVNICMIAKYQRIIILALSLGICVCIVLIIFIMTSSQKSNIENMRENITDN